jgi:signal transduction histidine kinase
MVYNTLYKNYYYLLSFMKPGAEIMLKQNQVAHNILVLLNTLEHKVFIYTLCVVCVLSLCAVTFAASGRETRNDISSEKHVLFLNSYSRDFITVPVVINQVEDELAGIAKIQYFFMNTKNVDKDFAIDETKHAVEYLQKRYKFDLIITGDDDALDFVRTYRNQYFKDIPVVFEDVNSEQKVQEACKDKLMAGLVETFPMKETIALAVKLRPKATQLVIISDNSVSADGSNQQIYDVAKDFSKLHFSTLITNNYTTEALKEKLGTYGDDTILMFTVFAQDGSDKHYTVASGVKFISLAAKIPVFKGDEAGIGDGLFGGCTLSYQDVGRKTGIMAKKILLQEKTPAELGYEKGEAYYKFDVNMMNRFHIQKSQLPQKSIFINDPPTLYEKHKDVLIPFCALILVLIIAGLLYDRKRNRLFNERLAASKAKTQAAELSSQAKTEFLSHMSHDIRTPLNAIIGLTDLAKDDLQNPPKMADNLEKIHDSGLLLLELLNDILDMSRIESGKMELKPVPCNLTDFCASVKTIFESQSKQCNVNFKIVNNTNNQNVLVDKVRLNQIIGNLLSNAFKFTPAGGNVIFDAHCDAAKDGVVPCKFTVSDTGKGIGKEFQKEMFKPFTQEYASSAAVQGSGLGLSIVKNIVDAMHGTITVTSELHKGTTFVLNFNLPLAKEVSQTNLTSDKAMVKLHGKRVLLAEDNALNTIISTRLLEKVGIIVEHAFNGLIAVQMFEAAASGYYDGILMDIRMPVKDGHQATREIRALNKADAKTIPIIAMTADAFDGDVHLSFEAGMNAHLNKPIVPKDLYETLLKFM